MRCDRFAKTAVITGTSSGVGKILSYHFKCLNWNVIEISRWPEGSIGPGNGKNSLIGLDITNKSISGRLKNIPGLTKIDVLINNAGVFLCKPLKKCSGADLDNVIDTNLKGTINVTMACLGLMGKGSRIINIGSVAGVHGIKHQALYCASKFGINGFFDSLSHELTPKGILISTINPGGIDTPLWGKKNPYDGDKKKLLKPKDICEVVNYIIKLPPNVVIKNAVIHPINEVH